MNKLPFDIDNYHKVFNKYPKCLMESEGRVYGWWFVGNYFKRKKGYLGEYPPSYLKRVRALLPECKDILHLFGGTVTPEEGEITVDINPELKPSVCCDAETIGSVFKRNSFGAIFCDPPYNPMYADRYGYKHPNKKMVFRECRKIIRENGIMVWLDIIIPIFRGFEWNLIGTIGLFNSTNHMVRCVSIFQATSDEDYEKGLIEEETKRKLKEEQREKSRESNTRIDDSYGRRSGKVGKRD
jgi:hypothetical protein